MKKIFRYFVNTDVWGSYDTKFAIADSAEEVMTTSQYCYYKSLGHKISGIQEITSRDICLALGMFSDEAR